MMTNRQIADLFETIADMLQLKGEIIHRVLAYRRAAESIRELPRDLSAIAAERKLTEIDGIGKIIAEKINEVLTTGELQFYKELAEEIPPGLVDVLRVNGVGPKKAMLFYKEVGVASIAALEAAAKEGKLRTLAGMGEKSEAKILERIAALARRTTRARLDVAWVSADRLLRTLLALPGALRGDVAGSVRRGKPTIGDLDLLIASYDPDPIMEHFVHHPDVVRVLGHGSTKSSVELASGLQCDLRIVPPERYGTALSYFTGSKEHNTRLREMARDRGLTLNEWAFAALEGGAETLCAEESEVYAQFGLPFIPPELREDRGEIDLAARGALPTLITIADIRADLHMHTTWSDGKLSIRDMAWIARERGLQYIVITDHSQSLGVANGLTPERLRAQREEIHAVDAEFAPTLRVFQGVEMEIRADGSLDYPDEVLAKLDFVIASLHTGLRQPREQITARLLNAIRNPHVDLIGHPRGQMIPEREPADLDMDAVFRAALETDTALEINASPYRLDLDDTHARLAAEMGIKIAIDTDSHSGDGFEALRYGVITARRARLRAADVINTWSVNTFLEWLNG
ncbi:MAG TPA: DNA polymerase/3'-5' exonuclease PolX [Aggregatilineales bacterium]|nr:DNA polymerase/3'-5' exonuclease PolX [Anaerolineales bacterium]HRE46850.1 DNA polymerase/3'-5' exonuclease PolX [Aggregatilineales bacterium]